MTGEYKKHRPDKALDESQMHLVMKMITTYRIVYVFYELKFGT